jgi:undecaprenyl-diphosphatase
MGDGERLEDVRMKFAEAASSRRFRNRIVVLAGREIGSLVTLLALAGLILVFGSLTLAVLGGDTDSFDRAVMQIMRIDGHPGEPIGPAWLPEVARDVTALGSYAFLGFLFFAVIGYLTLLRKRSAALLIAAAVLGGVALSTLVKLAVDRPRPDIPHIVRVVTASFPSGHAMLSAIVFLTLGALLTRMHERRRIKIYFMSLAIILTTSVGLSRIYLGVHYPTDVLAGWAMGAAWAILCWTIMLRLQQAGEVESPERP